MIEDPATPGRCAVCPGKRPKPSEEIVLRSGVRTPICADCRLPNDVTASIVSREAFRCTLVPTAEQETMLRKHVGLARFVYNWALGRRTAWWDANKALPKAERTSEPTAGPLSKAWTIEHPEWSGELMRNTVTYALDAVDDAFKNFFRRLKLGIKPYGFPRFKKKGDCRDSFTIQDQSFRAEPRAIKLGKMGMIATHEYIVPTPTVRRKIVARQRMISGYAVTEHVSETVGNPGQTRYLTGRVLRIVVSRQNNKWFAAIMVERERLAPPLRPKNVIGVDMGTSRMITTSEGERFPASPELDRLAKRLRKLQRSQERKDPTSKNYAKQAVEIAAMQRKVADRRNHYIHGLANHLVDNYSVVVMENFDVRELAKRSGPTRGKRGAAIARRRIMQSGFGELRRVVAYKARWRGAKLTLVSGRTDQTCAACLVANEAMRERTDSKFSCPSCGHKTTRQDNTAQLLARVGRGEATSFDGQPSRVGTGSPI